MNEKQFANKAFFLSSKCSELFLFIFGNKIYTNWNIICELQTLLVLLSSSNSFDDSLQEYEEKLPLYSGGDCCGSFISHGLGHHQNFGTGKICWFTYWCIDLQY